MLRKVHEVAERSGNPYNLIERYSFHVGSNRDINVLPPCQTIADRNRQTARLEAHVEHGLEGNAVDSKAQAPAEAWRVLPAILVHLNHQQLQPALPGVLGRCRRETRTNRARSNGPGNS